MVEPAIIVAATVAIWKGSDWLESSSERLATYYGLPTSFSGAIIDAVVSSRRSRRSSSRRFAGQSAGVGAIVGSAIFNILVIPAAAGIATDDELESSRTLVYKEAQFYLLAVSVVLLRSRSRSSTTR